jgi:hypothetical protein
LYLDAPFFPVGAPSGVAATDTANISNAYAAAVSAGGGFVLLQAGTYKLNSTISLSGSSVGIIGAGALEVDGAGNPPTAGTVIQWTGAVGGTMFSSSVASGVYGCLFEGFTLIGGTTVSNQASYGLYLNEMSGCSFRNIALCNFSTCALALLSNVPSSAYLGPNHNTFDNLRIDVGTLYWQAYNGTHALSPSAAIGIRLDSLDGGVGDAFANAFVNTSIVHNYVGVWVGNSDSNRFFDLHCYGFPNSVGYNGALSNTWSGTAWVKVTGNPQRGVYVTAGSRINTVFGCLAEVCGVNASGAQPAQLAVYDMDFVDDTSSGMSDVIKSSTHCELTVTNSCSLNGVMAGTYYFGNTLGSASPFSVIFNDATGHGALISPASGTTPF